MTGSGEEAAFVCTVCARRLVVSHVPPTAPHCSSCGAATKANAAMKAKAGDVHCMSCGHVEPAYTNVRCPQCDTVYVTFAPKVASA